MIEPIRTGGTATKSNCAYSHWCDILELCCDNCSEELPASGECRGMYDEGLTPKAALDRIIEEATG